MAKGLEKEYYKLSEDEFSKRIENIRTNPNTVFFFHDTDTPYFFLPDENTIKQNLQLHKDQWEFDTLFTGFSGFGQNQLMQAFLIEEIVSTNKIENIHSTGHDIFTLLQSQMGTGDRKLRSIVNGYLILLKGNTKPPADLKGLRELYDRLMKGAIEKDDRPDGEYFRKKQVYITDGIKKIHHGFYPEEAVNAGMQEFLHLFHDHNKDLFERMILSHFLIETVHPFYDGNGRLGRFLFTQQYFNETGSYLAFALSSAFNKRKSTYYRAFGEARHEHMFGSLNAYYEDISSIIHTYNQERIVELKEKKKRIEALQFSREDFTKSEREILKLLAEASILSDFGVSNAEIMKYSGITKKTVISSLQKFRKMNLLEEEKISKTIYHRLKPERINEKFINTENPPG